MEPKKNPKADLARNSGLYFAIGLCLVLFLSWKLVEYKSYEKSSIDIGMLNVEIEEDEMIPLTKEQFEKPKEIVKVTQVIEVIEDEEEVEETVIESTETTQEEIIEEVEVMEEEVEADVPLPLLKTFPCFRVVSVLKSQSVESVFRKRWTNMCLKISATLKLLKKWAYKEGCM